MSILSQVILSCPGLLSIIGNYSLSGNRGLFFGVVDVTDTKADPTEFNDVVLLKADPAVLVGCRGSTGVMEVLDDVPELLLRVLVHRRHVHLVLVIYPIAT